MSGELLGRRVIVTGAQGRIGAAVRGVIEEQGGTAIGVDLFEGADVIADLSDEQQVLEAMDRAERQGQVDGIVHAHGLFPNMPIAEMPVDDWDRVFAVNVRSVMLTTKHLFQRWIERGTPGAIVTISSGAARSARAGGGHYVASKAAVEAFTQVSAIEGGPHGIRVNNVAPGLILDEIVDETTAGLPDYFQQTLRGTPLRRTGSPREVALSCAFLLSEASAYTTGATIDVSGGTHCGRPYLGYTRDLQ